MVEEKVFIVDMRETTASDFWKSPEWTSPWEERWGKAKAEKKKKKEERGQTNQERSQDQEAKRVHGRNGWII